MTYLHYIVMWLWLVGCLMAHMGYVAGTVLPPKTSFHYWKARVLRWIVIMSWPIFVPGVLFYGFYRMAKRKELRV